MGTAKVLSGEKGSAACRGCFEERFLQSRWKEKKCEIAAFSRDFGENYDELSTLSRLAGGEGGIRTLGPLCLNTVNPPVARCAKRDKVFFGIVAGLAAKFLVVNFKVGHRAASLAPPVVTT